MNFLSALRLIDLGLAAVLPAGRGVPASRDGEI
jgi:hypothetical protein